MAHTATPQSFPQRHRKKILGALGGLLLLLLLLAVGLAIGYWMVVPDMAEQALRERLVRLERDGGVSVSTGNISPDGLSGIIITNFVVGQPDGEGELVRVASMKVGIDRAALLAGKKVVSTIEVNDVTLTIQRDGEGALNLSTLRERLRDRREEIDQAQELASEDSPGFLRHFGGKWPDITVNRATMLFESASEPFPIERIETARLVLDSSGDSASVQTVAAVTQIEDPHWTFPREVTLKGTLATPLEQSELALSFDRPLSAAGLPPYPFLKIGVGDVTLSQGGLITADALDLATAFGKEETPLFSAKRLELRLESFTTTPSELRPLKITVHEPSLHVSYAKKGGSNLGDLMHAIKPSTPAHITARARSIATAIAQHTDPDASVPAQASKPKGLLERLPIQKLAQLIPDTIEIKDGLIFIQDERTGLPIANASKTLEMRDATLLLSHDRASGAISLKGGFEAFGGADGKQDRGAVSVDATGNYKTHLLGLKASARALDLGWIAQLVGPRLYERLQSGTLRAEISVDQKAKGQPFDFEGDVSLEELTLISARVSEAPITDLTLGYAFKGSYDPDASIPQARLLKTELDANVPDELDDDRAPSRRRITVAPPTRGALVFTRGKARFGQLQATVLPALYGLARGKPLPARLDLSITLPSTPVQTALDAIPDALLGGLVGTKLGGNVSWNFELEVPLYDASEMIWEGEPAFAGLTIEKMPREVDVRKITESFEHVITDEGVLFERQVTIPAMKVIPTDWLMENAGLTLEQVDDHWRRGGWFSPPDTMSQALASSPQYWQSQYISWQAAGLPWAGDPAGSSIRRDWRPYQKGQTKPMTSKPYGPYVFVPLHHISPWLIRAILTTEDNSFFKHDGFNRFALRQSIEHDLAAGDYVRGASTISMQLIKNLFLTRKKVMARKIQEAILVYLMESAIRVPKARLLEIYFNIIEFGPGVFGIHDAAVHYFGKRPNELTLAECAWLVTIVPGPKRHHYLYARGELSDSYFGRIKRYMKIMLNRERVTQEEFDAASAVKPEFYKPEPGEPALRPRVEELQKPTLDVLFPGLFGNEPAPKTPPTNSPTPGILPRPTPDPIPLFER